MESTGRASILLALRRKIMPVRSIAQIITIHDLSGQLLFSFLTSSVIMGTISKRFPTIP